MKRKQPRKSRSKLSAFATDSVQPVVLFAGNPVGQGNYQELVGLYVVVILLFVAFSFWFSFGMLA